MESTSTDSSGHLSWGFSISSACCQPPGGLCDLYDPVIHTDFFGVEADVELFTTWLGVCVFAQRGGNRANLLDCFAFRLQAITLVIILGSIFLVIFIYYELRVLRMNLTHITHYIWCLPLSQISFLSSVLSDVYLFFFFLSFFFHLFLLVGG